MPDENILDDPYGSLEQIIELGGEWAEKLTPETIAAISQYILVSGIGQQIGQMQYQDDFLALKAQELQLSEQQLQRMQEEFEFQSGPYWDFMKGDWFEFQQQIEQNDVLKSQYSADIAKYNSDSARYGSEAAAYGVDVARFGAEAAGSEVERANAYATAQMFNTEAARLGAEVARYQAMASMGLVNQSPTNRRPMGG